jgi:hypothetical protein
LGPGQVAGLQSGRQGVEGLRDLIVLLVPSVAVMVMRVDRASSLLLNILLQRCVILLRRREVAALQTLRQGGKGLSDRVRIRGGGRGRGGVLRSGNSARAWCSLPEPASSCRFAGPVRAAEIRLQAAATLPGHFECSAQRKAKNRARNWSNLISTWSPP